MLAFLPFAEQMQGRVASILSTFGRVPVFYYLLHSVDSRRRASSRSSERAGSTHGCSATTRSRRRPFRGLSLGPRCSIWCSVVVALLY
jgi:hypothetical protein